VMPAVASTLHNMFSSCGGQIVNARKPAASVVPVTVGTGIEYLHVGQKSDSQDSRNSRNMRDSQARDRNLSPCFFIFRYLEMAGVLLSLGLIARCTT
jgi:hypothetical protein